MIVRYTDEELLEGLKQRDRGCIEYMYNEFFPVVRHFVFDNSGNQQDSEDAFQDTILVLYKRCMLSSFRLACSLKTFVAAIGKNIWLQRLDRKYRLLYQADCEVHEDQAAYGTVEYELSEENLEKQRLFYKNLMMLPSDCRQILQLYCMKVPFKEIARMLKYKNEKLAKVRKYTCKNLLRKRVMNDPECRKLLNYGDKRNHPALD
jgi:RNA polymerase sigma factor (sigma-70 family)